MPEKDKKRKHVTFNMDVDMIEKLEEYCKKEKRTKSAAIELALELLLNKKKEAK